MMNVSRSMYSVCVCVMNDYYLCKIIYSSYYLSSIYPVVPFGGFISDFQESYKFSDY